MQLAEILYQKTNDVLKALARLCGGCQRLTRKEDLVYCIRQTLTTPEMLRALWQQLDTLSRKAVAAAYHNDGHFNPAAFVAQYGKLPERPKSRWFWQQQPILLDLFIYGDELPEDLLPLLEELVPPPDKFQLQGLSDAPKAVQSPYGGTTRLVYAETEQAGRHDLLAYLRLVQQGRVKISTSSARATLGSIKEIMNNLLDGDFLPVPENYRATDTIRPFGLDIFAQESGLVAKARGRNALQLTAAGEAFYQTQNPALLLAAFETWTEQGSFDELSRIPALKGQRARGTKLSPPAGRREAVIEALSWCPVNVWIEIQDFYRALKVWQFDFEVETTPYSYLYVGSKDYGALHGSTYWAVVKGLYVNVLLWEYLGSLGGLDLLYSRPEEAAIEPYADLYYDDPYLSLYDGLKYFRVNNLGAYLLGQAHEYTPAQPPDRALFTISAGLQVTLSRPDQLTPNDQHLLELVATPLPNNRYQLDTQRLLTSLEEGHTLAQLTDFLTSRHAGPLPAEASAWLEQTDRHSRAFKLGGQAVIIKAQTTELAELAMADPVLQKFCHLIDRQTLVIPANKEKAFRTRLKELAYVLLE